MVEKTAADASIKTVKKVEKGVERLLKKAWSVMDAAAEKQPPSQYLSDVGIRSIQGKRE